jgi:hypothetical protein
MMTYYVDLHFAPDNKIGFFVHGVENATELMYKIRDLIDRHHSKQTLIKMEVKLVQ